MAGIIFLSVPLRMLQKTARSELVICLCLVERNTLILNELTARPAFGLLCIISLIPSKVSVDFMLKY